MANDVSGILRDMTTTITLQLPDTIYRRAQKIAQSRNLDLHDSIMRSIILDWNEFVEQDSANGHKIQSQPHLDEEDEGTLENLHKHAADFDIGIDDLSVKIGHPSYEIPEQENPNNDVPDEPISPYDLWKHAAKLDIGVTDLSVNLDHYLYGLPKRDE